MTERLARAASRHPWRTIGAWGVLLVLSIGAVAALLGSGLTSEGGAAGNPEFRKADHAEARAFPPDPKRESSDIVIVRSDRYTAERAPFRAFVAKGAAEVAKTHGVTNFYSYYDTHDPALISPDRHATAIPVQIDSDSDEDRARREAAHDRVRNDQHPEHRDDEGRAAEEHRAACRRTGPADRIELLPAGVALLAVARDHEQRVVDPERETHPREHVHDEDRELPGLRDDGDEAETDDDRRNRHQDRHQAGDDGAEHEHEDDQRCR